MFSNNSLSEKIVGAHSGIEVSHKDDFVGERYFDSILSMIS